MAMVTKVPEIFLCCQCNRRYQSLKNFYKIKVGIFSELGYLPICKTCAVDLLKGYEKRYKSMKKAMQRFCMAFDLYYSDIIYESCEESPTTILGNYIRKLNMQQYYNKNFDSSLKEGFVFNALEVKEIAEEVDQEKVSAIDPKVIEMWGEGFDSIDYDVLESHYKYLHSSNPNCDGNQEIFIKDLCYNKMKQMKALRDDNIENYNKLSDSYRRTFSLSGLKISKETNIAEDFSVGVNAETIEKYTPAEYYKNKQLYRDYDDIGDYIERFLLRPLRNLMHGSDDRDVEYYVKDEGDDNAYVDDE